MHARIAQISNSCEAGEVAVATSNTPAAQSRRGLRVLLVVESAAAGTGRHVMDLAQGLIERQCDVHLIYSTLRVDNMFLARLGPFKELGRMALPIHTAPHPSDYAAVRAIQRYMSAHGPFDVIHGHSSKGGALSRLAALATRVPVVYTPHGIVLMDPQLSYLKWAVYFAIEVALSWRTARIVAVSPEEQRAAKRCGLGRRRVILTPNGVGPANLTPRDDARRTLGVADNAIVVGFVGRLVEPKAPDVLVRAAALAMHRIPHMRLAMVGGGPMERQLRELAANLGINQKVIWLGERDAREVMAAFDLFAISSRKEGLPYVILEAMAAGLPVVATNLSGAEILVDPGINGVVVRADDYKAFGTALGDLANNPQRLAAYGRASLERASLFTIDLMVDRTLKTYLSVAGKASRP